MKHYDFETVRPRYDVNSVKYLEIKKYFPEEPEDIIPFSVADMELQMAPEIREGLKKYIDTYVMGYSNATDAYYEAICDWMQKRHDWHIEREWILTANGVVHGFFTAVRAYTERGDGVILCTPIYYPMYAAVTTHGCETAECPLINKGSHYEIDFELLEKLAGDPKNKLLLFCNPHNPGGRVWTREELERVGEICLRNHVIIVSDEIHFDLIKPGIKHTVFAGISPEMAQNCVVLTAPSKSFNLAGMMTANAIIPNAVLRRQFLSEQKKDTPFPNCSPLGFEACRIAYTECGEWLDELNALVAKNAKLVKDFVEEAYPEAVVMDLEGSYLLWMDFSALGIDCHKMAEVLRTEGKLFFDDGYIFGKAGEGFERWNLACPTRYVQEALPRLKAVLDKYRLPRQAE